ncbi:formyl transferase [Sphingomonas sp. ASV193]|uniref:glucosamine inositolphosphorylceramide transferase family protein n=1 Tax=Sphingomonas sp. ASV193 TaxID=3144405 RepID=UPI0032E8B5E0
MDLWRCGYVEASLEDVIAAGGLAGYAPRWLPSPPGRHRFLADPFGSARGDTQHVFAEALDYRDRRGRIVGFTRHSDGRLEPHGTVLEAPWHLSYPVLAEEAGELFMLPEAHRGGGLWLYRATDLPTGWTRDSRLGLPFVPVDATPLRFGDRWLLLCARAGAPADELHLFESARLAGPWRPHPASPLRTGNDGSRPGGTALVRDGAVLLPVQDNRETYGGALRLLTIMAIGTDRPAISLGPRLTPPADTGGHDDGLHTLAACGPITLFDVKRIDRSLGGRLIGALGKVRRAAARSRPRAPRTGRR